VERNDDNKVMVYAQGISHMILLIESHDMSLAIIQGDSRAVVAYLSRLTFQVSVLFNIAIIIASLLFGKILTNFIEQKPGLAGFRVF